MTPEILAELENLAWIAYKDTKTFRAFEAWSRLWRKRREMGDVIIPEGAWETP